MEITINKLLKNEYPQYDIKRATTCCEIMRVKRKVKAEVKRKVLGIYPIYNYCYHHEDLFFERIRLKIEDSFKDVSIAIDQTENKIYWRF